MPDAHAVSKPGDRNSFEAFHDALGEIIPAGRLIDEPLRRLAYGTDASFYRLTPRLVICAQSLEEIQKILQLASLYGIAITFRAAGTSLSGQAVTDSVLLTLGHNWQSHEILDDGDVIRLQPGLIGSRVNELLAPLQRRIGPDPASLNTARIGGIAANNASGMCCGTAFNSYQTLQSMKLVLADGTVVDTDNPLSCDMFRQSHPALLAQLTALSEDVRCDQTLSALIRKKYRLKNTTGYAINALLDFSDPIDILQHLMIGSEGTLGFIAGISLQTVPEEPHKATALLVFHSLDQACVAVSALEPLPVSAVELMDRKSLAAVAHLDGMPAAVESFPTNATALLIEVCGDTHAILGQRLNLVNDTAAPWKLLHDSGFIEDRAAASRLWAIRKGLFPAVGAVRETGTTVIIEDVSFPVEQLAQGVSALHRLLEKHGYHQAVMFGHALLGNLHFVFTQSFEQDSEVQRYGLFMAELAQLVAVDYQGSLKAEHGTGRNMAPFVELEWGRTAYQLMWRIKRALDPNNILNPGVVLNEDPDIHLKNLKPLPAADPLIDHCIECGFCEPTCPSGDLTLTPRQRITSWREIQRLRSLNPSTPETKRHLRALEKAYDYAGNDTCAACGLCEIRCPVNINTGDLTRSLRSARNRRWQWLAMAIADRFGTVIRAAQLLLKLVDTVADSVGRTRFARAAGAVHKGSLGVIPLWSAAVRAGTTPPASSIHSYSPGANTEDTVIYLPACPGRLMDKGLAQATIALLERAGFTVIIHPASNSQCCGMPFSSKGFADIATASAANLQNSAEGLGLGAAVPLLCDASPCSQQLANYPHATLQVYDAIEFFHDRVLPRLKIQRKAHKVAVHVTCSGQRAGLDDKLMTLARACSEQVIRPAGVSCCGFAGDKGFTLPALNASALASLSSEIPDDCKAGYSSSRTCEIGLTEHSGIPYRHIVYLLLEATDPCSQRQKSTNVD